MNRQWRIARRPRGNVTEGDFQLVETPIPQCAENQILLQTHFLNLAPVMRMYMSGESAAGEPALAIGDLIHGRGVAQVLESRHPGFEAGDMVQGQIGWQEYKVSNISEDERFTKIPDRGLSYGLSLGPLGMTGYSAYFGFVSNGEPKSGDTVVVSAAAGGVGSIVIQLAKIHGCRVIGIAGGQKKCAAIAKYCDATIDYKSESVSERLLELLPDGLDIYFDNVGGDTLSACLDNLALNARIVLCGSISEYLLEQPYGLSNYTKLRRTNASMRGFFVYNYQAQFEQAEQALADWLREGRLEPVVDVSLGFNSMPIGLARLYSHKNIGTAYCDLQIATSST